MAGVGPFAAGLQINASAPKKDLVTWFRVTKGGYFGKASPVTPIAQSNGK